MNSMFIITEFICFVLQLAILDHEQQNQLEMIRLLQSEVFGKSAASSGDSAI